GMAVMNVTTEFVTFLQTYPVPLSIAAGLLTILALIRLNDAVALVWLKIRIYCPVFGRSTRLSRQLNQDSSNGWFHAEQSLCRAFRSHAIDLDGRLSAYDQSVS